MSFICLHSKIFGTNLYNPIRVKSTVSSFFFFSESIRSSIDIDYCPVGNYFKEPFLIRDLIIAFLIMGRGKWRMEFISIPHLRSTLKSISRCHELKEPRKIKRICKSKSQIQAMEIKSSEKGWVRRGVLSASVIHIWGTILDGNQLRGIEQGGRGENLCTK